jgi:hypothetical protein
MSVPAGTKNSRAEGFLLAKHKPTNIPRLYFILTITWSLAYVVCKHRIDDRTSWTCFAGHFDGHDNAPVRCQAHQPIQHVQGYLSVGTLKDGYVRNVPLPRVPQIQSASPTTSRDPIAPKAGIPLPGYLHVPSWIPTLPKLGSILGFSQRLL